MIIINTIKRHTEVDSIYNWLLAPYSWVQLNVEKDIRNYKPIEIITLFSLT